jgi:hypothetical protein
MAGIETALVHYIGPSVTTVERPTRSDHFASDQNPAEGDQIYGADRSKCCIRDAFHPIVCTLAVNGLGSGFAVPRAAFKGLAPLEICEICGSEFEILNSDLCVP